MARDGHLRQLTRDQSLVQGLVDEGILTPEEARHHPRKNIILQVVGTDLSVVAGYIERRSIQARYLPSLLRWPNGYGG